MGIAEEVAGGVFDPALKERFQGLMLGAFLVNVAGAIQHIRSLPIGENARDRHAAALVALGRFHRRLELKLGSGTFSAFAVSFD